MQLKNKIKTVCVMGMMVVSMASIAFAGGYHGETNFLVTRNGGFHNSGKVEFDSTSVHTERVEYNKIETSGTSTVSIKKWFLGVYKYVDYREINVTSASIGVAYNINWGTVSSGTRYYFFENLGAAQHYVKEYKDIWS